MIIPTHDYKCDSCGVVQEFRQSIHKPLPESLPCPRCGEDSFYIWLVAPGLMTSNMTHKSIDVAIGRDAEARWEKVNERKAQRDRIRRETGKTSLTAVGVSEYVATDKKLVPVQTPEPKED